MTTDKPHLTRREAAAYLGISLTTLCRETQPGGKLVGAVVRPSPRTVRLNRAALDRLAAQAAS